MSMNSCRFLGWLLVSLCWLPISASLFSQDLQFDSAGCPISYRILGRGDPILLVHGFAVTGQTNWAMGGILEKLAERFQVVLIDVRGHGRSGKPLEVEQYGIEMVNDLVRLLDHLHFEQARVLGYSMGGIISLKLAVDHPERVHSVCIGGAGWLRPDQEDAQEFIEQVAHSLETGNGPLPLLKRLNPQLDATTAARVATTNSLLKSINNTRALASVFRSLPRLAIDQPDLAECKVPALFVIGTADPAPTSIDRLKEIKPDNFTIVELEGADHMTTLARPEFYQQISTFLAK